MAEPRTHDDGTGKCAICGRPADHRHTGDDRLEGDDDVLVVEFAPELLAAMGEADERDIAVELPDVIEGGGR